MKPYIYLSHDGLLDHIGQSQILPYLKVYSKITTVYLITFEKEFNLYRAKILKKKLEEDTQIKWIYFKYHKNIVCKIYDFIKLTLFTLFLSKKNNINFIHCRSYFPAISIYFLNHFLKYNFLFDIRDFWADEGIEIKKYKIIYKLVKLLEGKIIQKSCHVVCLTQKAKNFILNKYSNIYQISKNKITVIPCGTEFNLFNPRNLKKNLRNKIQRDLKLKNRNVLLYYGSIGENYLIDKMINFFRVLKSYDKSWIFLFLINNDHDYLREKLNNSGLHNNFYRITSSNRKNLPYYLSLSDLSIFYYRQGMRSIGCSPTKLADLFAMNVPVITSNFLGDMDKVIKFSRNYSYLIDSSQKSIIINHVKKIISIKDKSLIRKNSKYFDFLSGTNKYKNIYKLFI